MAIWSRVSHNATQHQRTNAPHEKSERDVRLRRLLAEKLIATQQQHIYGSASRVEPVSLRRLRPMVAPHSRRYLVHCGERI
jgi:hypothetical protein